jgi:hypothetical protein
MDSNREKEIGTSSLEVIGNRRKAKWVSVVDIIFTLLIKKGFESQYENLMRHDPTLFSSSSFCYSQSKIVLVP